MHKIKFRLLRKILYNNFDLNIKSSMKDNQHVCQNEQT